jgi:hypothetical protein
VLFPIFLFLAWRFGKNKVFWAIVVMAAISLLLSEWGWRNKATANFYLAPARAWELFSGSIAAFIIQKRGVQSSDVFSLLGLAAIIFAIFAYDEETPFPSAYALVPVIGVVLLVLYADKETFVAKLLSTKVFVGIGLISYSAYLWHQPLFSFARIRIHDPPTYLFALLSLMAVALAYFSWRYIEKPFRSAGSSFLDRRGVFSMSLAGLVLFIFLGLLGHWQDGFNQRVPPLINKIDEASKPVKASCLQGKLNDCVIGNELNSTDFILIGDSHAGRYAYAFEKLSKGMDFKFRVIAGGWCAPLLNWGYVGKAPNKNCFPFMENSLKAIAKTDVSRIVLAAEWGNYTQGFRYNSALTNYVYSVEDSIIDSNNISAFKKALKYTIEFLESHGKSVLIIEPVPEYEYSVPLALSKSVMGGWSREKLRLPLRQFDLRNKEFFDAIKQLDSESVDKFDVKSYFCDETDCSPYSSTGLPLYNDGNHLTQLGLEMVQEQLIRDILNRNE